MNSQNQQDNEGITQSRFKMWRAVFALAHADNVIAKEEKEFMCETLNSYAFNEEQRQTLETDMVEKRDVADMFSGIKDPKDRRDFFTYARLIVWCDGNFDAQERKIMATLKKAHLQSLNSEGLLKDIHMAFDDEEREKMKAQMRDAYKALQKDKKEEGGFFGSVVRRMWTDTQK